MHLGNSDNEDKVFSRRMVKWGVNVYVCLCVCDGNGQCLCGLCQLKEISSRFGEIGEGLIKEAYAVVNDKWPSCHGIAATELQQIKFAGCEVSPLTKDGFGSSVVVKATNGGNWLRWVCLSMASNAQQMATGADVVARGHFPLELVAAAKK